MYVHDVQQVVLCVQQMGIEAQRMRNRQGRVDFRAFSHNCQDDSGLGRVGAGATLICFASTSTKFSSTVLHRSNRESSFSSSPCTITSRKLLKGNGKGGRGEEFWERGGELAAGGGRGEGGGEREAANRNGQADRYVRTGIPWFSRISRLTRLRC